MNDSKKDGVLLDAFFIIVMLSILLCLMQVFSPIIAPVIKFVW
jgi:hypothetical protein